MDAFEALPSGFSDEGKPAVPPRSPKTMLHHPLPKPSDLATILRAMHHEVRYPLVICVLRAHYSSSFVLFGGELVLNLGNAATDVIPIGTRIALAFLSSAAVRSAGFQGVAISSLTPATQFVLCIISLQLWSNRLFRVLYLIMMYIAVYPVAMRCVGF